MSWRERDYHRTPESQFDYDGGKRGHLGLPAAGTATLIVVHALAFCAVFASSWTSGLTALLPLASGHLSLAGLLGHPFATTHLIGLGVTLLSIWTVAGRLEDRYGSARMLLLYLVGNLTAGLAFMAYARLVPSGGTFALTIPAGGLAAWCGAAWLGLRDEYVSIFGRLTSVARTSAIGGAIVVALVLMRSSSAATAWIVAAIVAGGIGMWVQAHGPSLTLSLPRPRARRRARNQGSPRQASPPHAARASTDVDAILQKISRYGIDSLSGAEREQLDAVRRTMLERER